MTRRYEVVYIFDSALEEAQVNEHLERFHGLLTTPDNATPVSAVNHWGKRSMAYAIKGKEIGYYVVADYSVNPTALPEFERAIKLDENVMRYLVVLNEGEAPRPVRTASSEDDDGEDGEERE